MITISKKELDNMELSGMSEQNIADSLGVSRMGLYKYRKRNGYNQLSRSDKGKERTTPEAKREANRQAQARYYAKHGNRGRNKRIRLKIMTEVLGRKPKSYEVLHHIDGNPANNERNNLVICTQSYHMSVLHG